MIEGEGEKALPYSKMLTNKYRRNGELRPWIDRGVTDILG